jgi:hypothetical protein
MTTFAMTLDRLEATAARSTELCAEFPSLYTRARALVARSRELCLVYRRIRGGSDLSPAAVTELITRTPMCLECLGTAIGVSPASVAEVIERVRAFLSVKVEPGACGACRRKTTIHRVLDGAPTNGTATAAPAAPAISKNAALWQFLERHRGQMYCTQCIAVAMLTTKRIDRAVIGAEGRGARRQYGTCMSCGKERLLCGLPS